MESNSKKSWYLLEYLCIVVCTFAGIAKVGHVYNLLCICLKIYLCSKKSTNIEICVENIRMYFNLAIIYIVSFLMK